MARTSGAVKADKSLKGPRIGWTGAVIRDGRGYYGEGAGEKVKPVGAFPAPNLDDVSRKRFSPLEQLKRELGKTVESSVTYRDGAEVTETSQEPKKPNSLKAMWERLRADPKAMEDFIAKKKAGLAKWRAKRKEKNA